MNGDIKFRGYKSFSKGFSIINKFPNITVFIGRNNSGKSSCIDIIESLTDPNLLEQDRINGLDIQIGYFLTNDEILRVFRQGSYGGVIPGEHYEFGKDFIGKEMFFRINTRIDKYSDTNQRIFEYISVPDDNIFQKEYNEYWSKLSNSPANDYINYKFRRLGAERNILAEQESNEENFNSVGTGASNLVRKFLNYSEYNEGLVEVILLNALNKIVSPDAKYSGIKIQQVENGDNLLWEIFLQEGEHRYALSKMGSGLKTIILVLLNLLIIPETKDYKGQKILYAFEELENNLHPALQRRLFDYLYDYSVKNKLTIFLTTHSHVAINVFCNKDNAQIYHVIKDKDISTLYKIDDFISQSSLLNDLDVRASDLLQSNGIIWVEGPSDRVYLKKWLEVFSDRKFEEGRDYQFLYYGGKLLSHYTADSEKEQQNLINVLITNRNAAIIIDSDKKNKTSSINDTKKRVEAEFNNINAFSWITKGKEIENYISHDAIKQAFAGKPNLPCNQYELFPDYIEPEYHNFKNKKVEFAQEICKHITLENSDIMDLRKKIQELIKAIGKWNPKN